MNRVKARRRAFEMIFEMGFGRHKAADIIETAEAETEEAADEFTRRLVTSCEEKLAEIDSVIEKNSVGWTVARMSGVTAAVLRLAVCELLYADDVPVSVTINEAVELAKKYEGDESAAFINGILGAAEKSLSPTELTDAPEGDEATDKAADKAAADVADEAANEVADRDGE